MATLQASSYYATLEIGRDATPQQVSKAFRRLALKYHPDKHGGAEPAVLVFAAVAEAYEVLSNPSNRALYDRYDEAGLKDGVPDGRGGLVGGAYRFSGDAQRIFDTFFGASSPFGDIFGGLSDPAASAAADAAGAAPAFYGELTSLDKPVSAAQPRPLSRDVHVSLAQLYTGDVVTVPQVRKLLNPDGVTTKAVTHELKLTVLPGWAEGYKVRAELRPAAVPLVQRRHARLAPRPYGTHAAPRRHLTPALPFPLFKNPGRWSSPRRATRARPSCPPTWCSPSSRSGPPAASGARATTWSTRRTSHLRCVFCFCCVFVFVVFCFRDWRGAARRAPSRFPCTSPAVLPGTSRRRRSLLWPASRGPT